jgi:hypothetical protein
MSDTPEPPAGPAESRAVELLRLVGSQTPAVSSRFTAELVARVRAQRAVAGPLRALSGFVAALLSALGEAARAAGRGERRT